MVTADGEARQSVTAGAVTFGEQDLRPTPLGARLAVRSRTADRSRPRSRESPRSRRRATRRCTGAFQLRETTAPPAACFIYRAAAPPALPWPARSPFLPLCLALSCSLPLPLQTPISALLQWPGRDRSTSVSAGWRSQSEPSCCTARSARLPVGFDR